MVANMLARTGLWLTGMAALLFLPAGTFDWPAGWTFIAIMAASGIGMGLWLARHDPDLLAQRMGSPLQRDQKVWDKVFIVVVFTAFCGWFVVMALDAARYRLSHVPILLGVAGVLAIAACMYLSFLAFRENTFAAPVVKVQREHKVIDTGPYAVVRHPMYSGAILYFFGVPLLLGSWIGLALAPLLIGLVAARILLEEDTLRAELPGHTAYAARVRWRLLPGVW